MDFYEKVYKIVAKIPKGKVMTYGQIASIISTPRAAQMVGFALRASLSKKPNLPWQRVVNSKGMISIVNPIISKKLQAELLKKEGIEIILKQNNYYVDLKKYLFKY